MRQAMTLPCTRLSHVNEPRLSPSHDHRRLAKASGMNARTLSTCRTDQPTFTAIHSYTCQILEDHSRTTVTITCRQKFVDDDNGNGVAAVRRVSWF